VRNRVFVDGAVKIKKKGAKPEKKTEEKKEVPASTGASISDDLKNKQAFKKFSFRGEDITAVLAKSTDELAKMLRARQRRRLRRKLDPRYGRFLKKVMEAKKKTNPGEKPKPVKTHLRDCIVLPQMVQGVINIHSGKAFSSVEVKPEMIGYYLGEFSMTYKRVTHGKPGVGATHSSKFTSLK